MEIGTGVVVRVIMMVARDRTPRYRSPYPTIPHAPKAPLRCNKNAISSPLEIPTRRGYNPHRREARVSSERRTEHVAASLTRPDKAWLAAEASRRGVGMGRLASDLLTASIRRLRALPTTAEQPREAAS